MELILSRVILCDEICIMGDKQMTQCITILTIGSRGDVQPYVALGRGLQAEGYHVTLATHQVFETFVTERGLNFAKIAGDPRELLTMLASEKVGAGLFVFQKQFARWLGGFMEEAMKDFEAIAKQSDLVIFASLGAAIIHVLEGLDVPAVSCNLMPIDIPTTAYPNALFPTFGIAAGGVNHLTYRLYRFGNGYFMRGRLNEWRREMGVPTLPLTTAYPYDKLRGQPILSLHGYSPSFLPRPDDYPPHAHVTGYWFLDAQSTWEPSPALTAFINGDEPPVYVGFGSLIDTDAEHLINIALKAVRQAGKRLLLLSGWADLNVTTLSEDVFVIKAAPHDWLFPQMAAVVHHGGAGTTSAGLRAGVPTVVVPFFADQPFWGRMIYEHGLGAAPVPARTITEDSLAEAIRVATETPAIREQAAAMGQVIRGEDGVGEAVKIIRGVL